MLSPIQFEIVERKGKIMVKKKQNPWSLRRTKNGLSTILCKYQCLGTCAPILAPSTLKCRMASRLIVILYKTSFHIALKMNARYDVHILGELKLHIVSKVVRHTISFILNYYI